MKKLVYYIVWVFVRLFVRKSEIVGTERLPEEPVILLANHSHIYGPIVGELDFPGKPIAWCAAEMLTLKTVPAYVRYDFWRNKPACSQWLYRIASYLLAPLSVCVFGSARTIPVYRDGRVIQTIRQTVRALESGQSVFIFPEKDAPYNHILCDFQDGFVSVAQSYYRKTKRRLTFVPVYIAPHLHKAYIGEGITYDPTASLAEERARICTHAKEEITRIALSLPEHTVVPYNNIPRRLYKTSKGRDAREKAGR